MADVQFYHQERVDGGMRSGVYVDSDAMLHGFVPGGEERDPALTWYADVTLSTPTPPGDETVVAWLQAHAPEIRAALGEAAEQLRSGLDVDTMPWELQRQGSEGPIRVSVPMPLRTRSTFAPTRSQRFAISFINEMRVASIALAAYLVISADGMSMKMIGLPVRTKGA